MTSSKTLTILQYSVRKSQDTAMATLLRDKRVLKLNVLAIQS